MLDPEQAEIRARAGDEERNIKPIDTEKQGAGTKLGPYDYIYGKVRMQACTQRLRALTRAASHASTTLRRNSRCCIGSIRRLASCAPLTA